VCAKLGPIESLTTQSVTTCSQSSRESHCLLCHFQLPDSKYLLLFFNTGPWHRVQLFDLLYMGPWHRVQLFDLLFVSLTHSLTH